MAYVTVCALILRRSISIVCVAPSSSRSSAAFVPGSPRTREEISSSVFPFTAVPFTLTMIIPALTPASYAGPRVFTWVMTQRPSPSRVIVTPIPA